MCEINIEICEDTGNEICQVWDNGEQIYEGYFEVNCPIPREEKVMIIMANALGFEPSELLNLDIFN